ncbi:serine/threonine-protein kinase [Dactylosporangium sp. NPDC049140]|uniref:serine/threonine-protein kinase n=1 Tax=Dactylosporangium sp. NPDC049140 TaxID=3155647 RepID=UPI0034055843
MASEGDLLNDRYRLDDRIAAGGMGEVWRADDTLLGRCVAVKLLHDGRAGDREFQSRFHHEARAMAALHHPGIAAVYDYGEYSEGSAYIVMAFIDGQPLDRRIAEDGRLDPATTMSIVAQAAHALEAAHAAGIVHRDVKPGNLIVQPDGTVVLVDFGVARSAAMAALTATNDVVGTALYIAPEQVSKQNVGPATDVYALGAVAYHCVAGRPPFMGDSPIAIAVHHLQDEPPPLPADVPAPISRLITTAMDKQPARRYPSAAAMAAAAEAATVAAVDATAVDDVTAPLAGAGIGSAAVPPAPVGELTEEFGPRPPRRRSPLPWALGLLAALAIGLAVWLGTSDSLFHGPGGTPAPSGTTSGDSGVGTAPAGGGGAGNAKTTGGTKTTGGPSAGTGNGNGTTGPGGGGAATPTTAGGGGGATPTGGGAETTGPAAGPTPTTAVEATAEPLVATSG